MNPGARIRQAVLLLAHGSPGAREISLDQMQEFLRNVTNGRELPPQVVEEIRHRYRSIGGSPLGRITAEQAELLAAELKLPVYYAMRNWEPYIPEIVSRMESDGVERAVAICLAPHNSRTSVGLYRRALFGTSGDGAEGDQQQYPPAGYKPKFEIDFVESWHDQPELIEAFAERFLEGWSPACAQYGGLLPVIFTAHSVPVRTITEGDPYEAQARHTAELVAEAVSVLSPADWRFAFQSQGVAGGPWLGPTVEDTIAALESAGHRGVFVQPIGFLCDHVEVLYDIDIAFKRFAEQQGMRLWRAKSLNDSPALIRALAAVARARLAIRKASQ
jgi:ferrochelatase